jgi:hypothetical protein
VDEDDYASFDYDARTFFDEETYYEIGVVN